MTVICVCSFVAATVDDNDDDVATVWLVDALFYFTPVVDSRRQARFAIYDVSNGRYYNHPVIQSVFVCLSGCL